MVTPSPGLDANAQQQRSVDRRFRIEAAECSRIYDRPGIEAELYRLRRDRSLEIIERLETPGATILELGCGAGRLSLELARRGYRVTATDRLGRMVRLTRSQAAACNVGRQLTTVVCDARSLPFAKGSFNLIVALGVLPWFHSPIEALTEVSRVLPHGGKLLVTSDNKWSLTTLFDPLCSPITKPVRRIARALLERTKLIKPNVRPRLHYYSPWKVDQLLCRAGLSKSFGLTIGFGPCVLFKSPLFSEQMSMRLHRTLQRSADRHVPLLELTGVEYVVVAENCRQS